MERTASMCESAVAVTNARPPANDNAAAKHFVEIELSVREHGALLKFERVDAMQLAQLRAGRPIGNGDRVLVKMDSELAETLAGDLAYVVNRSNITGTSILLYDASEAIELALE